MPLVKLSTAEGDFEFIDEIAARGGVKDVYFSPDRSYVAAFFRHKLDAAAHDRLKAIVGVFRQRIFDQPGGEYWKNLYTWPQAIVEWQGRTGIIVPSYQQDFRFTYGSKNDDENNIRGAEKEGKWFSARNRNLTLDPREKGTWLTYLQVSIQLARAVRRLHAAGLAHSDLSYKNVLIDPVKGRACIIDIDGLVVPNKYPPEVLGSPDFIAPEVLATASRHRDDPARIHASILTDRHALAVLIYLYLLCRHPLRGGRIHDSDPARDEELMMGEAALFIEHPEDDRNRVRLDELKPSALPWGNPADLPYTVTGPRLAPLIHQAFTHGLHDPAARPSADEWEHALVQTVDLLQPCANVDCEQKWFVADTHKSVPCPFCGTATIDPSPILELHSGRGRGVFTPDNHHLIAYDERSVFAWHANRSVFPSERLPVERRRRVAYIRRHKGAWLLVNEGLPDMYDRKADKPVPVGSYVHLLEGGEILLDATDGGRLVRVRIPAGPLIDAGTDRREQGRPFRGDPQRESGRSESAEHESGRSNSGDQHREDELPPSRRPLTDALGQIDWFALSPRLQVGDLSGLDTSVARCVTEHAADPEVQPLARRLGVSAAIAVLLVLARAEVARQNWAAAVFMWSLVPADAQPQLLDVTRMLRLV